MFMLCSMQSAHRQIIDFQRDALIAIIATLLALVNEQVRLPRHIRISVLRVLRPVEAAVRRLIFVVSKDAVLVPVRSRNTSNRKLTSLPAVSLKRKIFAFPLADPMPPMIPRDQMQSTPHIWSVAPRDPTVTAVFAAHHAALRRSRLAAYRAARLALRKAEPETPPETLNDGLVDASRLASRLEATRLALADLPRQAQRLLRWTARREKASLQRLTYTSPIRPGPPPYLKSADRGRRQHEVSDILHACHCLAREQRFNSS
jgi:hypothetical protein